MNIHNLFPNGGTINSIPGSDYDKAVSAITNFLLDAPTSNICVNNDGQAVSQRDYIMKANTGLTLNGTYPKAPHPWILCRLLDPVDASTYYLLSEGWVLKVYNHDSPEIKIVSPNVTNSRSGGETEVYLTTILTKDLEDYNHALEGANEVKNLSKQPAAAADINVYMTGTMQFLESDNYIWDNVGKEYSFRDLILGLQKYSATSNYGFAAGRRTQSVMKANAEAIIEAIDNKNLLGEVIKDNIAPGINVLNLGGASKSAGDNYMVYNTDTKEVIMFIRVNKSKGQLKGHVSFAVEAGEDERQRAIDAIASLGPIFVQNKAAQQGPGVVLDAGEQPEGEKPVRRHVSDLTDKEALLGLLDRTREAIAISHEELTTDDINSIRRHLNRFSAELEDIYEQHQVVREFEQRREERFAEVSGEGLGQYLRNGEAKWEGRNHDRPHRDQNDNRRRHFRSQRGEDRRR